MEPVAGGRSEHGAGVSKALTPHEALANIPGWDTRGVRIEALPGGLTNRSFKVNRGGETFVLRVDADHTAAFGLDRYRERRILDVAADAGLAPDIEFGDEEAGVLLTRFVDGQAWTATDLAEPDSIVRVTALLRDVHALPLAGSRLHGEAIAAGYFAKVDHQGGDAELATFAERCVTIVAETPQADNLRCCHNDVVAENLVGQPRPMLIDWEYACDNDPLFDLASLIAYHELSRDVSQTWLSAYLGDALPEDRERLEQQCRLCDALHWLWMAARCSVSQDQKMVRRLNQLQHRIESRSAF